MQGARRRPSRVLLLVPLVVVLLAFTYSALMMRLEGEERSFWEALAWAGETLTSTGYGHDDYWRHPAMVVFVVSVQFLGVGLVFLVLPFVMVPIIEDYFSDRLPRKLGKVRDYALIYRYGDAVHSLIERLEASGVPVVIFEEDDATARRLLERGHRVVFGRLEDGDPEPATITRARFIVVNGTDHDNGAVIIAARQHGFKGEILALAEDPFHRAPMTHAGASAVYTPRHILAAALASHASVRISPKVAGLGKLGKDVAVREFRVLAESPVAGKTLAEVHAHEHVGATVLGFWRGGELISIPSREPQLRVGTILLAVGDAEGLSAIEQLGAPLPTEGPLVVVGYGEVGRKVVQFLHDADEPTVVINRDEAEGVDFVGDALDHNVLEKAQITKARAVIVALSSDSATLFATAILRNLAPGVVIIARVNRSENLDRIHRAGADFALSVSAVSGELLVHHLLKADTVQFETRIKSERLEFRGLAGPSVDLRELQQRTGAAIVARERGPKIDLRLPRTVAIAPGEPIHVCGSPEALAALRKLNG
ncbi:MAG: NAD-binding protein [Myxococcales bacterium]|nr:NAD-binding protein [Myxococcales bacterium]